MNSKGERNLKTALSSAMKYVQECCRQILHPLNTLKVNPDSYVTLVNILLSSALISTNEAQNILDVVLRNRRKDGSWPEILALGRTEEKSVVFTATVGCQLFDLMQISESFKDKLWKRLQAAADFVVTQEIGAGRFRKSENIALDTVNVNALASLFLVRCYNIFGQSKYLSCSLRGIQRVIKSQRQSGEFLYYTNKPKIPSVFYHSLTTNCLAKFYEEYSDSEILRSTVKGGKWLWKRQMASGQFSWEGSIDHWAYREFVTYPLAMELFSHLLRHKEEFSEPFKRTLRYILSKQARDGSFPVKDYARSLNVFFEDIKNAASLIRTMPRSFPLSGIRSTRIFFYSINSPFEAQIYRLLSGCRSFIKEKFVSTVETADKLIKCSRFNI